MLPQFTNCNFENIELTVIKKHELRNILVFGIIIIRI